MFEYSVITPKDDNENTFFIVPLDDEENFVSSDCDTGKYDYARLDLMLEILNGYQANLHRHSLNFDTEHYHYTREQLDHGVLAKVTVRK